MFLGAPASFPLGPLRAAVMLRRPAYFMAGIYLGGNRYHVVFERIADFSTLRPGAEANAVSVAVRQYAAVIERHCRLYPYNWFNFLDFWLRRGRIVMLLLSSWLVGSAAVAASAADAFDHLMMQLRQRQHGHVSFTEVHISSALDRPLESSGELFYDAPDRLEKRTVRPRPERMVLEKGQLSFELRHKAYHVALADYPQAAPYIEGIRATLAGDRPALERVFRIAYSNKGDQWTLRLTPLDVQVAAEVAAVSIDGSFDVIKTVTVQLVNGDRSITTLGAALDP
jgi:hypothetical protein